MANVKSGRGKKVIGIIIFIVVIVATYYFETSKIDDNNHANDTNLELKIEHKEYTQGELILTMIDVGQADSFLLMQDGKTALIDCGTRSTGKDVVKYLNSIGVSKLDYVFGTHPHDDHMGGMYDVITNIEVGKIIIPEVEAGAVTSNWYMKLMDEIQKNGYQVENPEVGDIYQLGEAQMKVIGPMSKFPDNINNYSTVLKVSFCEMDIIMTGDAEKEVEEEILASKENIDAEILKVGHHGSNTSTTDEFLDAIDPEYALISAGIGNKHEHPTKTIMKKLKKQDIEVYRTDESGTVTAIITHDSVKFDSEPGDYLSGVELEEKENSK